MLNYETSLLAPHLTGIITIIMHAGNCLISRNGGDVYISAAVWLGEAGGYVGIFHPRLGGGLTAA